MYLIEIRTTFQAQHRWKNAPEEVKFLRNFHRHLFQVEAKFEVIHGERDMEFFITKAKIDKFISKEFANKQFELSCEHIAEKIAKKFKAQEVLVREDEENAGIFINN